MTSGVRDHEARRAARVDPWLLALLAPLPFLPTLWSGLVADDFFFAALLREVTAPFLSYAADALLRMRDVPTTFYRPLPFITLLGEIRLWGGDPWPMHATNLVLHALCAVGVWRLASAVLEGSHARAAALVATLGWAWFPRRVETVAWLSCRPDLLATALGTWAMVAWIAGERGGSPWRRVLGVAGWFAAMASKESVVVLPLALAAVDWRVAAGAPGCRLPARVGRLWPFAVGLAAFLVARRTVLGTWVGGYGAGALSPSLSTAVKQLIYPVVPPLEWLNRPLQDHTLALAMTLVMGACVAAFWGAVLRTARRPDVRFGAAWALAAALPVLTLLPSLTSTMNDRLMYASGIGFSIVIGGWLARSRGRALGVAAVLVVAFAWHAVSLSEAWRVAGTRTALLVEQVAEVARRTPESTPLLVAAAPDSHRGAYMLRNGLGFALKRLGVPSPLRAVPLTHYLLEDVSVMPVEVRVEGDVLRAAGRDGRAEVMVGSEGLDRWAEAWVSGMDDRFGRHREAKLRLRQPGLVLVASPERIESLGVAGPAQPAPGEPGAPQPLVPVRQ